MKAFGKTMIVTGAGGGIGRQLVLQLLAKGAKVAALDVNQERLDETAKIANKPDDLAVFICDISKKDMVDATVKEILAKFGTIDGLINNAGIIQPFVDLKDLDYKKIQLVMNVNFYGPLHLTLATLPHLLERPEGHIVNVSSMGGFFPFPGQTIYGASKAAVKLMTEGLYAELLDTKVHVTVVFPGAIATDIAGNSGVKMSAPVDPEVAKKQAAQSTSPEACAGMIIQGMEKNKFQVYAGNDSKMMRFMYYKLSPKFAIKQIAKMMKNMLK